MGAVGGTIESYDRAAEEYLETHRDRTVMETALARFAGMLRPRERVLDVGCGPGFDGPLLRERGLRVVGVDLSRGMLELGRRRFPGTFVRADLRKLPFVHGVSGLWVNASFLHLRRMDVPAALRGFVRVLRVGGVLFVSVKEGAGERWINGRRFTFWSPDAFDMVLGAAGFAIVDGWTAASPRGGTWLNRIARPGRISTT